MSQECHQIQSRKSLNKTKKRKKKTPSIRINADNQANYPLNLHDKEKMLEKQIAENEHIVWESY